MTNRIFIVLTSGEVEVDGHVDAITSRLDAKRDAYEQALVNERNLILRQDRERRQAAYERDEARFAYENEKRLVHGA